MSKSRFIRDAHGSVIGRIDDHDNGSRAYDARGSYVGRDDRNVNHTHDNTGRVVTVSGDALASLIFGRKR
jgi:hypothetical protein